MPPKLKDALKITKSKQDYFTEGAPRRVRKKAKKQEASPCVAMAASDESLDGFRSFACSRRSSKKGKGKGKAQVAPANR